MVLIFLLAVLVLAIAFFQVLQGLYGAVITAILSVVCMMVAFTYYEPLGAMLYEQQPAHADAAMLFLLFFVPLIALRFLTDIFLRRNMVFSVWTDRIGGGVVGLFTGIILAGMLAIIVQMLPLGPSALTYRPYDDSLQPDQSLMPFHPDRVVLGLVRYLSGGPFANYQGGEGAKAWITLHDDLPREMFCARNQVLQTRRIEGEDVQNYVGRVDASPDSLKVLGVFELPDNLRADVPENPLLPENNQGTRVLVIRVAVDESARDTEDNWWRLPATHFRLVTQDPAGSAVHSQYPMAYLTGIEDTVSYGDAVTSSSRSWRVQAPEMSETELPKLARLFVARPWKSQGGPKQLVIDWIYRIDREDLPQYVEFRRVARVELPPTVRTKRVPLPSLPPPDDTALHRIAQRQ